MDAAYDTDVVAWSKEQAALLRAGRFSALDIEHIADEVEDVGKSEQRELADRMALLLAHLLKWRDQPVNRSASWEITIRVQRQAIIRRLAKTRSLHATLADRDWWSDVWGDAIDQTARETGLGGLAPTCPWTEAQILGADFLPS